MNHSSEQIREAVEQLAYELKMQREGNSCCSFNILADYISTISTGATDLLSSREALQEERDLWIANAKNLQTGYNELDKEKRELQKDLKDLNTMLSHKGFGDIFKCLDQVRTARLAQEGKDKANDK